MARKQRSSTQRDTRRSSGSPTTRQAFGVLLVDVDSQLRTAVEACSSRTCPLQIRQAQSLSDARQLIEAGGVDLAFINADFGDGAALDLAEEIHRSRRFTQMVVVTENPTVDGAVRALRLGAADYLAKPIVSHDIAQRLRTVLRRQHREKQHVVRVRRLRRLCRKLDDARKEVSQQVDILCSDLVTAYQELAQQMQQVVQTSEYGVLIKDELDLENLLRRTLEYLVQKAGPTNAAVFLPATMDEFSLGGYVNYDCTPDSADMLLQHLADVMAPRVAGEDDQVVHVTDNEALAQWIGDDAAWLTDSHVLAFAARNDDETLAVLTLFRDGEEPFSADVLEACRAVGPMLGEALARLIRIHHRHHPDFESHGMD